jgi:hypothetical protein
MTSSTGTALNRPGGHTWRCPPVTSTVPSCSTPNSHRSSLSNVSSTLAGESAWLSNDQQVETPFVMVLVSFNKDKGGSSAC